MSEVEALAQRLEIWAGRAASGYEIPAAAGTMHEAAAMLRQQARELADAYAQIEQTNRWHAEALDKLDALTKGVAAVREATNTFDHPVLKEWLLALLDQHLAAPAAAAESAQGGEHG